jgi:hypothetical protein
MDSNRPPEIALSLVRSNRLPRLAECKLCGTLSLTHLKVLLIFLAKTFVLFLPHGRAVSYAKFPLGF